ncbi:MAG: septal ring lytic transglycosylase RlpA family protein [Gallionellaceae bacterium]|jgi:rare lipoprotein A
MKKLSAILVLTTLTLAACSSAPKKDESKSPAAAPIVDLAPAPAKPAEPAAAPSESGGYLAGDGPGADAPVDIASIPDAVPKAEPLHRYANRPYTALGQTYTPLEAPGNYKEVGIASWYGKKFHGQHTSIGEIYDMYGMTAAHPTLPIPSYARVTHVASKKSVIVRINDRGPFLHGRIIDLSYSAAHKLDIVNKGSDEVEVESLSVGDAPVTASVMPDSVKTAALAEEPTPPIVEVAEVPVVAAPVVVPPPVPALAPAPAPVAATAPAPAAQIYLQLGAFKQSEGAESFMAKMHSKLGDGGKKISLNQDAGLGRVLLGPYASKEEARAASIKLKARLGFKPFVNVR